MGLFSPQTFFSGLVLSSLFGDGVHLCNTFRPTDPGDQFARLYTQVTPTKQSPLIVVLDEVDIIITRIHKESLPPHHDLVRQMHDKNGYNGFFDDLHWKYPHVIFLMTSNSTKEELDKLDTSYLRQGRVDGWFQVSSNGNVECGGFDDVPEQVHIFKADDQKHQIVA